MRVVVFTPCSGRKRFSPETSMQAQNLTAGKIDHIAFTWGQRMKEASPKRSPDRLYCGRSYREGRRAAQCLNAELVVISAGYGFVSERDMVAPYSLTIIPGNADSITHKITPSEWSPKAWWRMLGKHTSAETDLHGLLAQSKPDLILMSLSAAYAKLISGELQDLAPSQRPRLRIFCAATQPHIPTIVAQNIMPYDSRLNGPESPIRGTMSDFSGRALYHYAQCISNGKIKGVSLKEDKADLLALMSNWTPPDKPRGKRQTDEEIITFILDTWPRTAGLPTNSLRLLRDSGKACEQGRFRKLFNQAVIQREAYRKDAT